MSEVLASIEMSADWLGALLGLILHIAVIIAVLAWHVVERRRVWPHSTFSWVAVKLATPVLIVGLVFLILSIFNTDGMEGLAVFYGGILVALVLAPILLVGLARVLNLDVVASAIAVFSTLFTLSVLWFSGNGVVNQWGSLTRVQSEERAEYLAMKIAAEHADSADGIVSLRSKEAFALPDQKRLIHLAFDVDPDYRLHTIDVRTPNERSPTIMPNWSSTLGSCVEPGVFHMASVLDTGEEFDIRLRWHRGDPASMVEFVGEYRFPRSDRAGMPIFAASLASTRLTMPMPILSGWVHFERDDGSAYTGEALLPPSSERLLGMHPSARCLPVSLELSEQPSAIDVELYAEAAYERQRVRIPLLRKDP